MLRAEDAALCFEFLATKLLGLGEMPLLGQDQCQIVFRAKCLRMFRT
jgi:hypothetical protein